MRDEIAEVLLVDRLRLDGAAPEDTPALSSRASTSWMSGPWAEIPSELDSVVLDGLWLPVTMAPPSALKWRMAK
jgi:hypothetical protein